MILKAIRAKRDGRGDWRRRRKDPEQKICNHLHDKQTHPGSLSFTTNARVEGWLVGKEVVWNLDKAEGKMSLSARSPPAVPKPCQEQGF